MKQRIFAIIIAAMLAVTLLGSVVFAEETEAPAEEAEATVEATEEAEVQVLSGTYISNFDQLQDKIEGEINEYELLNLISEVYYTEAYYFAEDGSMVHYTLDMGGVAGNYYIQEGAIFLGDSNYTVQYTFEDKGDEIVMVKSNQEVVFTKILDTKAETITMDDYSELQINKADVEVTDENVDSTVENLLASQAVTEQVTEGTVELGDTVNLDFSGILEGEEEPFEGGTASGQDLTLGSGMMIPGFEDAIVGHEIGSSFDITVTFPEEYAEELAGKNAVFAITLNSKSVTTTPELTDEWVKEYTAANMPQALETVDELKQFIKDSTYKSQYETAVLKAIQSKATVISYDAKELKMLKQYSSDSLNYYASQYGLNAATYASYMGMDSVDTYTESEAKYYLDIAMVTNKVLKDKGVEVTDEGFDAFVDSYLAESGIGATMTKEDFMAQSGEAYMWLLENVEYKLDLAVEALADSIVIVEEVPAEEVPAEEAPAEEVPAEEVPAEEVPAE